MIAAHAGDAEAAEVAEVAEDAEVAEGTEDFDGVADAANFESVEYEDAIAARSAGSSETAAKQVPS